SLAFIPIALLLPRALGLRPGLLVTAVVVTGAVTAVFRALGIVRWLVAMPALSDGYLAAEPGSAAREATMVVYTALNDYAGAVGEVLGVGLTGAVWMLLVVGALHRAAQPRVIVGLGALTAVLTLAATVVEPLAAVATVLLLIWFGVVAVRLLRPAGTEVSA
ncbi:MAG: DUF4386 family protein, partial [Phycicoccus sp.]